MACYQIEQNEDERERQLLTEAIAKLPYFNERYEVWDNGSKEVPFLDWLLLNSED